MFTLKKILFLALVALPGTQAVTYSSCEDTSLRIQIPVGTNTTVNRNCAWVNKNEGQKEFRCGLPGLSEACPVSCGTCDTACADAPDEARFKFAHYKNVNRTILRNCDFVGRVATKIAGRCAQSEYVCRKTCAKCVP